MLHARNTKPSAAAFFLLLMNGSLIALMLPLARVVTEAGMSPVAYALWQTVGAALILAYFARQHLRILVQGRVLLYCLISGATGVAFPNVLAFFVVGEIGSGLTSTLYAFPPIFTLMLSLVLRMESPQAQRIAGIFLACFGCFWVVWSQLDTIDTNSFHYYLLGFLVPVSLALGNVYRTAAWPPGAASIALAAGMMLGASVCLLIPITVMNIDLLPKLSDAGTYSLVGLQMLLTAMTYLGFFELQKRSNPVFLSQMGCISALVGLLIGMICFDESYPQGVWLGVLMVLMGLWLANAILRQDQNGQKNSAESQAVGAVKL